jgi:hypothetical protein
VQDRVAIRVSVNGPQAVPPLLGGTRIVRVQYSVRVCWYDVHALQLVALDSTQLETTQLTGDVDVLVVDDVPVVKFQMGLVDVPFWFFATIFQ